MIAARLFFVGSLALVAPSSQFSAKIDGWKTNHRPIRSLVMLYSRKTNGEDLDGDDDKSTKNPTESATRLTYTLYRRKRCVDYPSFAYRDQKPQAMLSRRFDARRKKPPVFRVRREPEQRSSPYNKVDSNGSKRDSDSTNPDSVMESFVDYTMRSPSPLEFDLLDVANSARRTRLLSDRSYARKEPFGSENLNKAPSLEDLSSPPSTTQQTFWIGLPARVISFAGAYFAFPFLIKFLDGFVTMPADKLDEITSKFSPGVAILYGTFVSLTLSILYTRQQDIQNTVATESSLLVSVLRNMLHLFNKDPDLAVEAGQCVADHGRTLVRCSRGSELMLIMYSDPFARMMELIDLKEQQFIEEGRKDLGGYGSVIGSTRDYIKDMIKLRSTRLSNEARALPPTHFLILTTLTILNMLGYAINVLPTVDDQGMPPNEGSLLFAVLFSIYLLFYNFATDLNNPFQGVYQVRRSTTATQLLAAKWLIANHPVLRGVVDFDDVEEVEDEVVVRSPGLGDLIFERRELFPEEHRKGEEEGETNATKGKTSEPIIP